MLCNNDLPGPNCVLQKDSVTRVRGKEQHCYSASPFERADLTGFLMRSRSRTTSMASQTSQASSDEQTSPRTPDMADDMELDEEPVTPDSPVPFRRPQIRLQSESSDGSSTITEVSMIHHYLCHNQQQIQPEGLASKVKRQKPCKVACTKEMAGLVFTVVEWLPGIPVYNEGLQRC